jgi:sugar phosphate isomerase/epimerase
MKLGVFIALKHDGQTIDEKFAAVRNYGLDYCQLTCWDFDFYTDEIAAEVVAACEKYGITISTFWAGWSGPKVWDFEEGPVTLGIVPPAYRYQRMQELMAGSDFAKKIGAKQVATHVGFIPENPSDPNFMPVVSAVKAVAEHCKENGQYFLFETGQETPVALARVIERTGLDNIGINMDVANLILYGKANPIDALDTLGKYVRDMHAKDGNYPTDSKSLGEEKKLGEGKVNFPALIAKLKSIGYDGHMTIEREISGDQQVRDIIDTKAYLESLINSI